MTTAESEPAEPPVESTGGVAVPVEDGPDATDGTLGVDDRFHLLQNERRRRAIRYLLDADGEPVEMRDLAEAVAAAEYDTTVEALACDNRQRVYITLYQSHLPQLADAGVIEYDKDRGTIETTPLFDELGEYVDDDEDLEPEPGHPPSAAVLAWFGLGGVVTLGLLQVFGVVGTLALYAFVCTAAAAVGLQRVVVPPRQGGRR